MSNSSVLLSGIYPASVTPFDDAGRVSPIELAKLMAYFEASGCQGVVLAGTNGEGPSLTAPEKRDMIDSSIKTRGKLQVILGIASPSLEEAKWLTRRASDANAAAVLVMPPSYFRAVSTTAIRDWFLQLMDASLLPVLAYNFPKMTGIPLGSDLLSDLAQHPQFAGAKDSSGEIENLVSFRQAVNPEHCLFVGDERLLIQALKAGWTGSISGVANVLPDWLSIIAQEWNKGAIESAETKFEIILPIIELLRSSVQPATNKALLKQMQIIVSAHLRLPLTEAPEEAIQKARTLIEERTGALVRL